MTKTECSHMRLRLSRPYLTVFQTLIMGSTEKAGPAALVMLVWHYLVQFFRGKNIPLRQFFDLHQPPVATVCVHVAISHDDNFSE